MKPTNSPTQGQPNPRKNRFKVAIGPLFPIANNFSWVGIGFIKETDNKKPNPTKFSANTQMICCARAVPGITGHPAKMI